MNEILVKITQRGDLYFQSNFVLFYLWNLVFFILIFVVFILIYWNFILVKFFFLFLNFMSYDMFRVQLGLVVESLVVY